MVGITKSGSKRVLVVEVVPQRLGACGVTELTECFHLNLSDPLARYPVNLADLIKGARFTVGQSKAQSDDACFTLGECGQHGVEVLAEQRKSRLVKRDNGLGVRDEVAELAVALRTKRLVQRQWFSGVALEFSQSLWGDFQCVGELFRSWLAAEISQQVPVDIPEFIDQVYQVDG